MSRSAVLFSALLLALGASPAAAFAVAAHSEPSTVSVAGPGGGWCC